MRHFSILACVIVMGVMPCFAETAKPFSDNREIDLLQLLPPPPANTSQQTKAELAEILKLQATRTPQMIAHAQADVAEEVWQFADVLGPKLNKSKLPLVAAFFDRLGETEGAVVDPAKAYWKRPRPYVLDARVKPVVKKSSSFAWPSGHATIGTLMGIELANMVPEKRAELLARAWAYGNNRIIGGVHFRSDVEMGRISGTVIAARIKDHLDFKAEFEAARVELRKALNLPI